MAAFRPARSARLTDRLIVRESLVAAMANLGSLRDPDTRITLRLNPAILPDGRPFPFSRYDLRTIYPADNPLTQEAFEAVLNSAQQAGLGIEKSPDSGRP